MVEITRAVHLAVPTVILEGGVWHRDVGRLLFVRRLDTPLIITYPECPYKSLMGHLTFYHFLVVISPDSFQRQGLVCRWTTV